LKYFTSLNRDNKKIKNITYIGENRDTRINEYNLALLDTNENIDKILITGQFAGDIRLKFYSEGDEEFFITYRHHHKKSNLLGINSIKYKAILSRHKINMSLKHYYKIEIEGSNNKYIVKFNGKKVDEIKVSKIKFIATNIQLNVLYN